MPEKLQRDFDDGFGILHHHCVAGSLDDPEFCSGNGIGEASASFQRDETIEFGGDDEGRAAYGAELRTQAERLGGVEQLDEVLEPSYGEGRDLLTPSRSLVAMRGNSALRVDHGLEYIRQHPAITALQGPDRSRTPPRHFGCHDVRKSIGRRDGEQ
jgi:hypothetical protein